MPDDKPFVPAADISASVIMAHWRKRAHDGFASAASGSLGFSSAAPTPLVSSLAAPVLPLPEVAVGVLLVDIGERVNEGDVITAVTPAWTAILREMEKDPAALLQLTPRQLEELVAGAYAKMRDIVSEVVLTPRSGDLGRDVVVTLRLPNIGSIRILDQVKRYSPENPVPANDVRAMYGVTTHDHRAGKAIITTTSTFAPGVYTEFADVMPDRLELRDGNRLKEMLRLMREQGRQ